MSYLTDLVAIQNDAYDNLYDINITLPSGIPSNISDLQLKLRSGDVNIPEPKVEAYDIHYKTIKINKPKAKISLERKLTLQFRLDSEYQVYQILKEWQGLVFDKNGGFQPLRNKAYGKIEVVSYRNSTGEDSFNSQGVMKWTFNNVWISGVTTGPALKRESAGDPIKVTVEFYFMEMSSNMEDQGYFDGLLN